MRVASSQADADFAIQLSNTAQVLTHLAELQAQLVCLAWTLVSQSNRRSPMRCASAQLWRLL